MTPLVAVRLAVPPQPGVVATRCCMSAETEAVPNSDVQRGESAPSPGAADSQGNSPPSSANAETQIPNPVSSTNPETPKPAQKPKRKYTMSQAALDSRRINIKKPLAVPKEILCVPSVSLRDATWP